MFPAQMMAARLGSVDTIESEWWSDDESMGDPATSMAESNKEFDLSRSENRFFADSPYYDAFVEKEMHCSEIWCSALKEIASETESLCKAADIFFKSLRSLSLSCRRFSYRIQTETTESFELDPDIGMLQAFGETLEEISDSHKKMFEMIETCMGISLMELSVKQSGIINKLKKKRKDAEIQTKQSEKEICQYLHGRNAAVAIPESEEVFYCVPNPKQRRWSVASSQRRSQELRLSQRISMEETTAELKRFQLIKKIVDCSYDRKLELGRSNGEVLKSMQNCFQQCLDKVENLIPFVNKNQEQCLNYQKHKKPLWKEGERQLMETLTTVKRAGEVSLPHDIAENELTEIETDSQMWDLPDKLATVSKFCRPSPRDVLMEGWLYQKCSSMLSLQPSWVKRWFILKSDGIYYLQTNVEGRKSENDISIPQFKVKVFDIVLCTVKVLPDKPLARFCFELIDPSKKSIILQARGPKELEMWLQRIRSAVGSQLAEDNPEIELGTRPSFCKLASEIKLTVVNRKSWHVWDPENSSTLVVSDESATSAETDLDEDNEDSRVSKVLKANPECADCRVASPDWASLNLGILVCLECSGVHRSLGCHVSKVRSLTLDALSDTETSLLLSLGNERANKIWEQDAPPRHVQPCTQNFKAREDWIKRKYVKKEFMGNSSTESEEFFSRELCAACERGDVVGVATALANGASLDWRNEVEGNSACTALGISTMRADNGKEGAIECVELLLQNGARKDDL